MSSWAPKLSISTYILRGQTTDWGVESLLESEDENGVEVSDEVFGLLNEESSSEMENETSSVVEVSAGTGIKVIRASLTPGKATVEKEQSETPPVAHSQAAHVQSNTPPPVVSQSSQE